MNNTLNSLRHQLAVQNARGITFIASATVYWFGLYLRQSSTALRRAQWGPLRLTRLSQVMLSAAEA